MVNILHFNEMTSKSDLKLPPDLESEFEFMGILNFNSDIFVNKIIQKIKKNKNLCAEDKSNIIEAMATLNGESGGIEIDESIPINY